MEDAWWCSLPSIHFLHIDWLLGSYRGWERFLFIGVGRTFLTGSSQKIIGFNLLPPFAMRLDGFRKQTDFICGSRSRAASGRTWIGVLNYSSENSPVPVSI